MKRISTIGFAALVLCFLMAFAPVALATEAEPEAETVVPVTPEPAVEVTTEEPAQEPAQEPAAPKQGLVEENGAIYFYQEDGTLFTDGYKAVTTDGTTRYYYFQEDGTAFTGGYKVITRNGNRVYYYFQADGTAYTQGYLSFVVADKTYYFFFQADGTAFTGGYKEIVLDGQLCYFYFLANGQGYNTGYKTVTIGEKKYYYFFGEDGKAETNKLEVIPLGDRTAYMLFQEDGKAFTAGYKELANGDSTDYYYFLSNGQAFTTGYKTVTRGSVTDFYFFQDDGKAFTGGLLAVPFGEVSFEYYFGATGKGVVSGWQEVDGVNCYFQENGRVAKDTFVKLDGQLYYFGKDRAMKTGGWFCTGDGYYYAQADGALLTNTVKEGYALNADGKCATKYRVIQYVNKCTNSSMTDQEKIEAIYNWILKSTMIYIRTYEHTKADWVWKDSWMDDMVARHLDKWGGNCFSYNSLLGMMIHEATGLPVMVYHGETPGSAAPLVPHGWATVQQDGQWYVYDVELDKFTNYATSRCYKVPASTSKLHVNGVGSTLY